MKYAMLLPSKVLQGDMGILAVVWETKAIQRVQSAWEITEPTSAISNGLSYRVHCFRKDQNSSGDEKFLAFFASLEEGNPKTQWRSSREMLV